MCSRDFEIVRVFFPFSFLFFQKALSMAPKLFTCKAQWGNVHVYMSVGLCFKILWPLLNNRTKFEAFTLSMHYWLGLYRNTLIKKKTKIKWCGFFFIFKTSDFCNDDLPFTQNIL